MNVALAITHLQQNGSVHATFESAHAFKARG